MTYFPFVLACIIYRVSYKSFYFKERVRRTMTYYQNFQGRRDNPCLFFQNQNGGNHEGENCQSTSNGNESDTEGVINESINRCECTCTCNCNTNCGCNCDNACERICLDQCRCRYEQQVHCCEQQYKRQLACLQHDYECCLERAKCEYEQCKTCCKCQRNDCCCCNFGRRNRRRGWGGGFFFI